VEGEKLYMVINVYKELGKERRQGQKDGDIPEWFTTLSWQMFKEKFQYKNETVKETYQRISNCAASYTDNPDMWAERFFDLMWKGWLACSTPVLANMGTERGCSVSCSGGYIGDSVYQFYEGMQECAVLSQNGFGTSSYLGDVRERGAPISRGGTASGILPVLRGFVQVARDISQGGVRRGAWAGYVPIDHTDFWECAEYLKNHPDDCNIGWCVPGSFIEALEAGNEDAVARYQRAMKVKVLTGKGYFFFTDKAEKLSPPMYKELGLEVKASNLCSEIMLHSDQDHTFSCVLSSMNLAKWDEWKDTMAVFDSIVFLDCVAEDLIHKGKNIRGLEKVVRFTEKSRALGLGALGFHTLLQSKNLPIEGLQAQFLNTEIFKHIKQEADRATRWMAEMWGEPEWCKGYGVRNSHCLAVAPNTTSALICGSVSQGIEPVYKNVYTQGSAAGEMNRINPCLVPVMKDKGVYNDDVIQDILDNKGSVQHVDWLSDEEKLVFKTAFEINQEVLVRLASQRQQYICQSQSLNLFFSADEKEERISEVHKQAFLDPYIKSLYYLRSEAGVKPSSECEACSG